MKHPSITTVKGGKRKAGFVNNQFFLAYNEIKTVTELTEAEKSRLSVSCPTEFL
jgi:hypothetical protein